MWLTKIPELKISLLDNILLCIWYLLVLSARWLAFNLPPEPFFRLIPHKNPHLLLAIPQLLLPIPTIVSVVGCVLQVLHMSYQQEVSQGDEVTLGLDKDCGDNVDHLVIIR